MVLNFQLREMEHQSKFNSAATPLLLIAVLVYTYIDTFRKLILS